MTRGIIISTLATPLALLFAYAPRVNPDVKLSFHDARVLAEHTPAFLQSVEAGICPNTEDGGLNEDEASFVTRAGCGPGSTHGSGWVESLSVDLRTGIVTVGGPETIETPQLAALRQKLFEMRTKNRVTTSEAQCLLSKISTPVITESCRRIEVAPQGDELFIGTVRNVCDNTEHTVDLRFTIDRYSGSVIDAKTGRAPEDRGFRSLVQEITTAHAPPVLTFDDAVRLARSGLVLEALKRARQLKQTGCVTLNAEGFKNADELWLTYTGRCGGSEEGVRFSVNVVTGAIWVFNWGRLDSTGIRQLRESMLAEAKHRKTAAAAAVRVECGQKP